MTLDRTSKLVEDRRYLDRTWTTRRPVTTGRLPVAFVLADLDLAKLGPRQEDIDAHPRPGGASERFARPGETQLANTIIRAPVTGTILERNVEKGEFVTTGFVGDKGAKGYVVSIADLNDLKVEIDISQNDFAKLGPQQKGIVTTDAFPDRKYDGSDRRGLPGSESSKGHRSG